MSQYSFGVIVNVDLSADHKLPPSLVVTDPARHHASLARGVQCDTGIAPYTEK